MQYTMNVIYFDYENGYTIDSSSAMKISFNAVINQRLINRKKYFKGTVEPVLFFHKIEVVGERVHGKYLQNSLMSNYGP